LLAEHGDARTDDVEELRHDGRDAVEMAGAAATAQGLGDVADVDSRVLSRFVELGRLRGEDGVHAERREASEVAGEVARVSRQILAGPELRRVDEDRDDHERSPLLRLP